MVNLSNDWQDHLKNEFVQPYYLTLREFLAREYESEKVYPNRQDIFTALQTTSYEKTKVVILGQDPYHGPNQAHGFSFSVKPGVTIPPSLRNIYKELHSDLGCAIPKHGYLKKWAEEGVLLLNSVLTVRAHEANSHKGKGWEQFTDRVIKKLNERDNPVVFIMWGRHAQAKKELITNDNHFIIQSPHPSPFSANRGFFGSRPFSKANACLKEIGCEEIDWAIPVELD
ncbi:uracil-DNA glycosylase [Alteribacter populi]|uniref:uracil-DNA glycosylase n=1 Tax=Alteribacter populi TaxID=2011011 RepID=UPI000BBAF40C|nr:uracil-DNA glycosylase [Alteribacter populi]